MTAHRQRLSNRRLSENFSFELNGLRFTATISRFPDGRISELFLNNHKAGNQSDTNARDAAILLSFALQHGADINAIRKALCRDARTVRLGPVAAALDLNPGARAMTRPEQQIHRAVVQHLEQRGVRGLVFLHPANGGQRRPIEAAIFQGLGVRAGASDLLLWHKGKSFALELKAPKRPATEAQLKFLADMEKAGVHTALCHGLDPALRTLERWGLLRGVVQ